MRYYVGVDWADQTHAVWVVNEHGTKTAARTVPHTAEGLSEWGRELDEWRDRAGQLSELGDTYQVPLGLGLIGNVNSHVDLGLRFSFDNLLGQVAAGTSRTDIRSIGLVLILRT